MSRQKYFKSKKYGHVFTLIELMVVLAITSILATTLLSVMNMARERMKSQECVENERYIYSSILEYSHDNLGKVVSCDKQRNWMEEGEVDDTGEVWYITLEDYGLELAHQPGNDGTSRVRNASFYCPITGKTGGAAWIDNNPDYGLNVWLAPSGKTPQSNDRSLRKQLRFASIENLSEKVLLADTSQNGTVLRGDYRLNPSWIRSPANINKVVGKSISTYAQFAFRHPTPMGDEEVQSDGECNMVFADGRVEGVHFSDDRVSSQANLDKMLKPKDD